MMTKTLHFCNSFSSREGTWLGHKQRLAGCGNYFLQCRFGKAGNVHGDECVPAHRRWLAAAHKHYPCRISIPSWGFFPLRKPVLQLEATRLGTSIPGRDFLLEGKHNDLPDQRTQIEKETISLASLMSFSSVYKCSVESIV